jgi:hypothetical protein
MREHAVLKYRSVTVTAAFRAAMREHAVLHTSFRLKYRSVTVAAPFRAAMRCMRYSTLTRNPR